VSVEFSEDILAPGERDLELIVRIGEFTDFFCLKCGRNKLLVIFSKFTKKKNPSFHNNFKQHNYFQH